MAGINKVIIIGNLGADPDARVLPDGTPVTKISVATSEQWTDKNSGETKQATEWHTIVFYNRLAEIAAQYLTKGSKCYAEGKLKTRKWQDQNGQDRYTTEIIGASLQMLDSKNSNHAAQQGDPPPATSSKTRQQRAADNLQTENEFIDDDIPF